MTAAGANRTFQGQRGSAPSGVEVSVPDPAVPGKAGVGFLEEATAEGATSEGGRVPGPQECPGGESFLRGQPSNPTGAAAVPGPEGGSPGPARQLRFPQSAAVPGRGAAAAGGLTRPGKLYQEANHTAKVGWPNGKGSEADPGSKAPPSARD